MRGTGRESSSSAGGVGWDRKTSAEILFPDVHCSASEVCTHTQREDSLSLNYDARREKGDPGELCYLFLPDRACLLLRLSCSFLRLDAADTRLS